MNKKRTEYICLIIMIWLSEFLYIIWDEMRWNKTEINPMFTLVLYIDVFCVVHVFVYCFAFVFMLDDDFVSTSVK
jgi:hypothetical protein